MTRGDAATLTRNLMLGSDLDFNLAVQNVFRKSESFTGKATATRAKYERLNIEREEAKVAASNAAADAFKKATGSKVDTKALRVAASALLAATNWFEKWDITGLSRKYLKEVLLFAGITTDVLGQMKAAAAQKKAEAERLEKAAADALADAEVAYQDAVTEIAEQFEQSILDSKPVLAQAIEFEKLAASLMDTYNLLKNSK